MTDRVLVTGGAGYIGAHACKALAEAGFTPVVYDSLCTGHADFARWGPFVEGDVRDRAALAAALREHRPVLAMHFAALSQVGESAQRPLLYWDVNLGGATALVETLLAEGVDRLVFSSTAAVYGDAATIPIPETAPTAPVNVYGETKLAAERMMQAAGAAHGLRSIRLRYFNACGADPSGAVGEHHEPETHLIPIALDAAAGRRPRLSMFGDDYDTPDGTAIRDYIHVEDLAAAHVAAARRLLAGGASAALNVGVGRGASVAEVVRTVEAVTGLPVPVERAPRRAGDPPALVADPSAAAAALGWRARRDLAAAVTDAWGWHRRRFGVAA